MKRDLRVFLVTVFVVLVTSLGVLGQETTGTLEITVKDVADAVVPNVPITVSSVGGSAGFRRSVTTNDDGFVKILQVPPGTYLVTAAATSGFVERKVENVVVTVGRITPVAVQMTTSVDVSVDITADDAALDLTNPKVETTLTAATIELIPKGVNFSTVLKFSPATRPEPRSGQFQIDGASGSENVFLVDGQETTDILSGALNRNVNLPFSMIQEIQIKTGSYEAEFGGATGGVVSIITKGGGNEFQGEFGYSSRSEKFEPTPGLILYSLNGVPSFYTARKNHYAEHNPFGHVSGPIIKDKLWFAATYAPQILKQNRLIIYRNPTTFVPDGRVEHYFSNVRAEKAKFRLDAQPFNRLRLDSSVIWSPEIQVGAIPGYTSELSTALPAQAGNPTLEGARFLNQTGGRLNSLQFMGGGNYLVTSKIVASARFGHYYFNNLLGTKGYGNVLIPRVQCSAFPLSRSEFPANFGCQRTGTTSNGVTAFGNTVYDATTRDQIDADVTFSFDWVGSHELKVGWQDNKIGNRVKQQNTDIITLRSGTTAPSRVNDYSGYSSIVPLPNAIGSGLLSIIQVEGDVSSKNTGLYVQDKWQPNRRLTLTLGVRTERENVPSYSRGLPGMNFDFQQKIAPRLGASFDVTGDGKTNVKAFFGYYYDRFKLTLPRGSFGGDQYHQIYFDLLPTDNINNLNRDTILGAGNVPVPGGACPLNSTAPVYGRVRCDVDQRINSNTPSMDITETGGIDPNIDPFKQREITVIFQRTLNKNYSFTSRYTRKEVLKAVEDVGFVNSEGSTAYLIGNPGYGLAKELLEGAGLISPKAQRQYDAFEVVISRRLANNYYFSANYTFSRLFGNYSGLASSDEEGRLDPNIARFFDEPSAGFTVAGGPDNGRLATDRPHVFKAQGLYRLPWDKIKLWKSNTTDFDFFYTVSSGSLITSFVNIRGVEQIILNKRGDLGRTPMFQQTDFALRHNIDFGSEGRFKLKFDLDIINLFNHYAVINRGRNPSGQGGNIASTTNFDILDVTNGLITQAELNACTANNSQKPCYIAAFRKFQAGGAPIILQKIAGTVAGATPNPFYNLDASWQGKRTVRYGIRFLF